MLKSAKNFAGATGLNQGVAHLQEYMKLLRYAVVFGQIGFSLITPPVCMAVLGFWLRTRFGLGLWVILLCILAGLLAAGANGYAFFRKLLQDEAKNAPQERPVTFRNHE